MMAGFHDAPGQVLVVAEIGNNHEGDFGLAREMVRAAAEAGADAVKFQTITPERLVSCAETERIAQLSRFALGQEHFESLAQLCAGLGVMFMSTPFDLDAVRFLDPLVPAFKVASGDITFEPLLQAVAACAKPIFLSRGAADERTIRRAVELIHSVWRHKEVAPGLTLMHCVAMYPTPAEQANLAAIPALRREFGLPVGYSDHTLGIDAAVLAVALGARTVEKHFTLDHHQSDFRDHRLAADPTELKEMIGRIRLAQTLLGDGNLEPQALESEAGEDLRRSLCAERDIPAGTVIDDTMITWLRPGGGIRPGEEALVLGRRNVLPLKQGQQFTHKDLTEE